jgi:Sulfotransferase family
MTRTALWNLIQRGSAWIRWQALLRSCRLDPDQLPRPLTEPGPMDFLIVGCPRSGTSLMAALLFRLPKSVVCMEPWDGLRMPLAELFRSLRQEITETGHLSRGRLDVEGLAEGQVRWRREKEQRVPVGVGEEYLLGVKWPGLWRYLPDLRTTRVIVCLRHPVEIVQSFGRVGGRLAQGLEYDVAFHRNMNKELTAATDDPMIRRALLYEYIHSRALPHLGKSNVLPVRYERWFTEPARLLDEVGRFLGLDLSIGPPLPIITRTASSHPSELESLVLEYCPSAAALGYGI